AEMEDPFASSDGTFRIVSVRSKIDLSNYRVCRAWLTGIKGVIEGVRQSGQFPTSIQLRYTGSPAIATEIATGMESDMAGSSGGTLATIGILFWLTHRRIRPLIWLLLLLVAVLIGALAAGGLLIGTINVVSMGFAAILLGLAEDFGIVIYQ